MMSFINVINSYANVGYMMCKKYSNNGKQKLDGPI